MDCEILAFKFTEIIFWALQKTGQLHFRSSFFYEKRTKMVVLLWIIFPIQVGHVLEKFQIIWNCTTYRKKIESR
jgi:hypothetical protein